MLQEALLAQSTLLIIQLSVPVRNYPGSLVMDVTGIGGTWNGGEEITVTLDDGDLNMNSLKDQDYQS